MHFLRKFSTRRTAESHQSSSSSSTRHSLDRAEPIPERAYRMDADEAHRMQQRQKNVTAVKVLTSHMRSLLRPALPSEQHNSDSDDSFEPDNIHTPHFCYMKLLGSIPNFSRYVDSISFDSEKCEIYMNDVNMYVEAYELESNRKKYIVFEDNFQSSVAALIQNNGLGNSLEQLKKVCRRFETEAGMAQHDETSSRTHQYFLEKEMNANDASACAFILSFYTGSNVYQTVNRGASIIARHGNGEATALEQTNQFKEATLIMYYLIRALAHIEFHWGVVARAVTLSTEELGDYKAGNLITWIQFSSAKKGDTPPENFASRNTIFIIYSLTGRCIEKFSNFPEEEEVLFPPHSTFLVIRSEKRTSGQTYVYMRQTELGLCKYSVMWVDDYIFFDWWENKEYMEKASTVGTDKNVHFIPKASTQSALAFLQSDFGERLKNQPTFRIVTDMTRDEEDPPDNAGARLILALRELGFDNHCLVFTMNEQGAQAEVNSVVPNSKRHSITVTSELSVLEDFINFAN